MQYHVVFAPEAQESPTPIREDREEYSA